MVGIARYSMNFRNTLLDAIRDCLYELEIHSTEGIPNRPGFFYPVRSTGSPSEFARNANPGYLTPTWQTQLRPIRSQDVGQNHLIPSVFLRVASGIRSASGGGLQDSPRRAVIGDLSEDYQVDIQAVFRDGYGAADASGKALALSYQMNNFIQDLDKCLNVHKLMAITADDVQVTDAYVISWESQPALQGTNDEIVIARLVVQVNFRR